MKIYRIDTNVENFDIKKNNLRIINIDMVIIKHINIDMDICENIGIDMKFLEHINKKTKARTSGDCKCKDGVTGSIC